MAERLAVAAVAWVRHQVILPRRSARPFQDSRRTGHFRVHGHGHATVVRGSGGDTPASG